MDGEGMMEPWFVGQLVVCVDDNNSEIDGEMAPLVRNRIYVISAIDHDPECIARSWQASFSNYGFHLVGVFCDESCWYAAIRFRPIEKYNSNAEQRNECICEGERNE
jgi:hypothetical protein